MGFALYPFHAFSRTGTNAFTAAPRPAPAPPLPSYDLATTAYAFGSANHQETADQRGIRLPSGASALPGVADDWVMGLFLAPDEMLTYTAANFVIASKGTTGHGVSGASQSGLNIHGGLAGGGIAPFTLGLEANNAQLRAFGPGLPRSPALDRGIAHLAVWGQKGRYPFFSVVRLTDDGNHAPTVVHNAVGSANDGAASWKYASNGTTAQFTAGSYDFLSGFGGNVDAADGTNRRAAGGSVAGYFNVWGSLPFANGLPDPETLLAIAAGTLDPAGIAAACSGTLRYANKLRGPNDLGADGRGAVTAAATEIGTNANALPSTGAPLRQTPELRLKAYGDGFVFPMSGTNKTGSVRFAGGFAGKAAANSFEVRLVRVDDGTDLVGWTSLAASVDGGSGAFEGDLPQVPAGIAFRREIRWRGRPAIALRDGDRQAVGLVVFDISQSQLAIQNTALANPDGGSGVLLAPTRTVNTWMAVVKQPFFTNGQNQGGGPLGSVALRIPYAPGQHGDGDIFTYEALRRTLGVPVMFVDGSAPGAHPNRYVLDRQPMSFTSFAGFAPDGTATTFPSVTPAAEALQTLGQTGSNATPGIKPGTLSLSFSNGIAATDDGARNLVGAGIVGGTVNYETGVISGLAFAAAPPAGTKLAGTFVYFAPAPENVAFKPETGQWSLLGDGGAGLSRANQTGRTLRHFRRLRGVGISIYRVWWYSAFEGIGDAAFAALFDGLKAKFDALYPPGARALWGFALPGRSTTGLGEAAGSYRFGPRQQRDYAAARPHARVLGEYPDLEIANNVGPHQSPNAGAASSGARTFGERCGIGLAAAFGAGVSVEGPVLSAARFTTAARTAIELAFTLTKGTSLATADGSTTGLQGFRVAPAGTGAGNWDGTGFSAAIVAPDRIRLTKSDGAWGPGQRVAFGNGIPVASGGSSTAAADNAALLKMPSDNDNTFAGQAKYTSRAGNPVRYFDAVVVSDAN